EYTPWVMPFSLLDEGHTGVALFMVLSGYLFAKLLDGRSISYGAFFWNRALRLLPLLIVVVLLVGLRQYANDQSVSAYAYSVAQGLVLPTLPNGGWLITVEFHYYLVLPLFLWMLRKSRLLPLTMIAAAIAVRLFFYYQYGEVQTLAYWTIAGRIDQFALGMIIFQYRDHLARRHLPALLTAVVFSLLYWAFDRLGGFYQYPTYPSPSRLWILLPTIEGIAYDILIAWYDSSFTPSSSGLSKLIGRLGEYSYSIYLLHVFVVFDAARLVHENAMEISNFYLACIWSLAFFILMIVPGYLSFRFIEAPFLGLRKRYLRPVSKHSSG
ncbi:MAG: acyltransferase, partial [Burkholderiaceae bacterium]